MTIDDIMKKFKGGSCWTELQTDTQNIHHKDCHSSKHVHEFFTERSGMHGSTCTDVSAGRVDLLIISCTYDEYDMYQLKMLCVEPGR